MYDEMRKCTSTNMFIVPLLGLERKVANDNGLENAFIKDEVHGIDYENGVYLLFRPMNLEKFNKFIEAERLRKANIIDEYDYKDGYTMLVYKYDKKWNKDVEKILKGQFSQLSHSYQSFVPKTTRIFRMGVNKGESLTVQHEIIKKAPSLATYWKETFDLDLDFRTDEFWHHYGLDREVFTQKMLDELV